MAKITMTGGGGMSINGATGQVAYFNSSDSVVGMNSLYFDSANSALSINAFDPTVNGAKLTIQGDNNSTTQILVLRTGQTWGGSDIFTVEENGGVTLTSFDSSGNNRNGIYIGSPTIANGATTATRNVVIGRSNASGIAPGEDLTTGSDNVFIGAASGANTNQGNGNTGIGLDSVLNNISGSYNVGVGYQSMRLCTGSANVGIGASSGKNISNKNNNVFIGDGSGQFIGSSPSTNANTDSQNSVYIGANSRSVAGGNASNEIVIGYEATGNGSNSVTLGDTTITNTYLRGDIRLVEGGDIVAGTTTGTMVGTSASQKLALWGKTPIVQPTTSISGVTIFSPGAGNVVKTDDKFGGSGGYTLQQIVQALINVGILQ
jgi:hypothetical protein